MVAKSIVQIVVNSNAFTAYQKQFNAYQAQLQKQPGHWGNIGKAINSVVNPMLKLGAAVSVFNQRMAAAPTALGKFRVLAQSTVVTVDRLALGTAKIARNVANTAVSLLKWLGVMGAVSGLLGGAGLFGLSRLAGSAFEQRRQAKGTGTSIGEQRAFDVNYGKYVDSQSLINNVTEAMQDQSKRWTLYAAGLTDAQMRGKNPAEIADMLLPLLRSKFKQTGRTQQGAEAFGLTQFAGLQDLNRLANTSDEEFNASRERYQKDRANLDLADKTARTWQDFSIQLSRAGQQIETVFIKGLTPLVPALTKLSDSLAKALGSVLSNPKIGQWLESFGTGIEKAADYLGSDDFEKSVRRFVEGVSVLGEKIYWLMSKLGWVKGDGATVTSTPATATQRPAPRGSNMTVWQALQDDWARITGKPRDVSDTINAGMREGQPSAVTGPTDAQKAAYYAQFSALEQQRNLPPGLLRAVYKQESSEGRSLIGPMTKYGRALGPFQFIPQTAKEYGLDDPMDTEKSADAASKKFARLLKYYNGDQRKAIAAYNYGEGNLDRSIRKATEAGRPADWLQFTPTETQGYVGGVTKTMGANPGNMVKIDINNNTGGSATVSVNQLAR